MVKGLLVLYFGASLFFMSCAAEPDIGPPAAVVAAFEAVRDAALGPVSAQLETEEIEGPISWGPIDGLSYSGTLTITDAGDGNFLLVYDITITATNVSHSGYTITTGTVDMIMSMTVDDTGETISGSLTFNGNLTLTGGEITTITVTDVTVSMITGAATGTITFDGDEYPASDFNFQQSS